jgi:hypothetical protein
MFFIEPDPAQIKLIRNCQHSPIPFMGQHPGLAMRMYCFRFEERCHLLRCRSFSPNRCPWLGLTSRTYSSCIDNGFFTPTRMAGVGSSEVLACSCRSPHYLRWEVKVSVVLRNEREKEVGTTSVYRFCCVPPGRVAHPLRPRVSDFYSIWST